MKRPLFAIAAVAAVFAANVPAAIDQADLEAFEAECNKYAVEEGVAEDELDDYIAKCVQELTANPSEDEGAAGEAEGEAVEE